MLVPVPAYVAMGVQVPVDDAVVLVLVDVEAAGSPAAQEPERERDDHDAGERLGRALEAGREVAAEKHDRDPERDEGRRVAEAPREAEPARSAPGPVRLAGDERRDRDEVIRVGGVAEAEQHRDRKHDCR